MHTRLQHVDRHTDASVRRAVPLHDSSAFRAFLPVSEFPIPQGTFPWQRILCRNQNNSGDDVATSSKNFVNFCRITPEITGLICIPKYLYLAKIDLHICNRRAAIQKRHESALVEDDTSIPRFPNFV